jgi:hypothetical protein
MMIAIAIKIETPSIQPLARPSLIIPKIRDAKAAAIRTLRIKSSKFSQNNSQIVLIFLGILLLSPYLKNLKVSFPDF